MNRILSSVITLLFLVWAGAALAQGDFVGSFNVGDGPVWTTQPPTYSCVEACTQLFGGSEADYSCSTSGQSIDNQAFVDGYGDDQYCSTPVSEDFKVKTLYDCELGVCAYSAYVHDHSACFAATNYCFSAVPSKPVPGMSRVSIFVLSMMVLLVGFGILSHRRRKV